MWLGCDVVASPPAASPPAEWLPLLLVNELGIDSEHAQQATSYLVTTLYKKKNAQLLRALSDPQRWSELMHKLALKLAMLSGGDVGELFNELHLEICGVLIPGKEPPALLQLDVAEAPQSMAEAPQSAVKAEPQPPAVKLEAPPAVSELTASGIAVKAEAAAPEVKPSSPSCIKAETPSSVVQPSVLPVQPTAASTPHRKAVEGDTAVPTPATAALPKEAPPSAHAVKMLRIEQLALDYASRTAGASWSVRTVDVDADDGTPTDRNYKAGRAPRGKGEALQAASTFALTEEELATAGVELPDIQSRSSRNGGRRSTVVRSSLGS